MCFPKLSFCYRQIESTDILIHVFLLKPEEEEELENCVTICYHKWRNSLFSALCMFRRLRYLPSATDNKSFLLHYIKKEMKERIWERSVLSNIWEQLF